ncbi:MAG: polysaccharide biosynthesis protein [Microbacteriaceae bacterium]|nr:polysaccharide biosynthesis protein [Cryobacterium sp.]MBX3104114.1 polysaccharide biosynthesis protein [Cryobacterium sp.]MCC6377010.1 polysaccharide biosynthesis protein [Microbacteriaceae bacterium]
MSDRILIVGRGKAGLSLADDIRRRGGVVIGFLDDSASGEGVLGDLASVNQVVVEHNVDLVYFAIPSSSASTVRNFINSIESDNVDIAIVPRTYEILTKETVDINDLTDVDVLDLVGREPVKHDLLAAREFLQGKRVLVTGAAGSIGSRLTRQILAAGPSEVICIDWWENGIFFLQQDLESPKNLTFQIADVKDLNHMEQIFSNFNPQIVFHAAAYKHVPLMQENPIEAINNNVLGSLNLMELSIRHGVSNFVFVSTDKAVNPVNVMGATKRLGEMLMECFSGLSSKIRFTAVRFGNVIESNGSVMQIFRSQISKKKALTVTHPDVTRFFMTIDEASQLIVQAAALGEDREIFVLDMGEPVRIIDLAKSLIRVVDPSLEIEITGLRPGEKMFEELSYEPSKVKLTSNEKIFVVHGEKAFDRGKFMTEMRDLVRLTNSYQISNREAIERLRNLGFAIQ